MNIKLLRRMQKEILKHSDQFRMEWWVSEIDALGNKAGGCGTAACLAGWAVVLSRKLKRVNLLEDSAVPAQGEWALKLTSLEARRLFGVSYWPARFSSAYRKARTLKGKANAAVRRIDHFIKTKGKK